MVTGIPASNNEDMMEENSRLSNAPSKCRKTPRELCPLELESSILQDRRE